MSSYKVTINCDPSWVTTFDANGYKLIMAKAMGDANGNYTYNVVASTSVVTKQMIATWTDKYQMTGSTQSFQNGVTITGLSGLEDIAFGDTYFLASWSSYHVSADSNAPPNGFGFRNKVLASAVITLEVGDNFSPVFISPLKYPPGFATMTPLPKVCFWFQQNLDTGTMITVDKTTVFEVDLSDGQPKTITYDANGNWSLVSLNPIDYTLKTPAKVGHE